MQKQFILDRKSAIKQLESNCPNFSNYKEMTVEAAQELASYSGNLSFPNMTHIDFKVACALARHQGDLLFGEVAFISDDVATALGKHKGSQLDLRRLENITDLVARGLSRHQGSINIHCASKVSDLAAFLFACRCGDGGKDAVENHESVIRNYNLWFSLQKNLTPSSALAWVKHKEYLDSGNSSRDDDEFPRLLENKKIEFISPEVAKALATYTGVLCLAGLADLSDEASKQLGKFKGKVLELGGLSKASDVSLGYLAKIKGELHLTGLTKLSTKGAIALSNHKACLALDGLRYLSVSAAKELSRSESYLDLRGIPSVSLDVARALSKHNGNLNLSGLEMMSDQMADVIKRHKNKIILDGVKSLTSASAYSLSQHENISLKSFSCPTLLVGHAELIIKKSKDPEFLNKVLPKVESIETKSIEILSKNSNIMSRIGYAKYPLNEGVGEILNANKFKILTIDSAKLLSKHRGKLFLNGLNEIDEHVAAALANHEGLLCLDGLSELTPEIAMALAPHKGKITFNGLSSLSYESAEVIAAEYEMFYEPVDGYSVVCNAEPNDDDRYDDDRYEERQGSVLRRTLYFNGIKNIADGLAIILAKVKCNIRLDGLSAKWNSYGKHNSCVRQGSICEFVLLQRLGKLPQNISVTDSCFSVDFPSDSLTKMLGYIKSLDFINLKDVLIHNLSWLAAFKGDLRLNNISALSVDSAKILSSHKGNLILNGLRKLPFDVANELSKLKGRLELNGLIDLDPSAAECFAFFQGELCLNGLRRMSKDLAYRLGNIRPNRSIELSKDLPFKQTKELNKSVCALELNGINNLSYKVAVELAKFTGRLELNGLHSISNATALVLSNSKGLVRVCERICQNAGYGFSKLLVSQLRARCANELNFLGSTISESSAKAFAAFERHIKLNRLGRISTRAAKVLTSHVGKRLELNCLSKLTKRLAETLVEYKGILCLNGLKSISDSAALELSKHAGIGLELNGVRNISINGSRFLSQYQGLLYANNLEGVLDPDLIIKVFPVCSSRIDYPFYVYDGFVESLQPDLAKKIAQREGDISLDGLKSLSVESASELADGKCGDLLLNGLTEVDKFVAKTLSNRKHGLLCLNGIQILADGVAEAFSDSDIDIELCGLVGLSDLDAKFLSHHRGILYLNGVNYLSQIATKYLSRRKTPIFLCGLSDKDQSAYDCLRNNSFVRL
jgi:hypothetical protein